MVYIPNSKWSRSFLGVIIAQAMIGLALEAFVFGKFIIALHAPGGHNAQARAIDTFLSLFLFGFLYQIVLTYDALRLKNTIQIIGLCAYNVGLIIYAGVQVPTVADALRAGSEGGEEVVSPTLWPVVRPYLVAIPCICGFFTIVLAVIAWKLYDEFSWSIYKHISADVRMRKRYLIYQVYITLLKFDIFFFLSFSIQFIVVYFLDRVQDAEFGLTVAALPITVIVLVFAGYWARKERIEGMIATIFLYFAALAYFIFKLSRIYDKSNYERYLRYQPARRGLTTFAIITILLLIATITNAIWCTLNFNKGLKVHLVSARIPDHEDKSYVYNDDSNVPLGQVGRRISID